MQFFFLLFSFQLTSASFLRLFGLEKSIEPQDSCIDSDIHDECLTTCRLRYLECLASCNDSSYCESQCRLNFASCDASCPCGVDCPLGCERCDHPLCDQCKDAEISNDDYKMCVLFALDKQNDCIKQCPPNLDCMDKCYANYRLNVQSCPCIESEILSSTQYSKTISTTTAPFTKTMPVSTTSTEKTTTSSTTRSTWNWISKMH
ncbi:unnamed protein product [Oikopleura dioica]|uniref:Uncharacterized protein n=1 Tax=Oikopleura dioica TaxID=34765 RepID=E4XQR7_OIKDI|nr:unnamed protein product [Oikopleura dioica]